MSDEPDERDCMSILEEINKSRTIARKAWRVECEHEPILTENYISSFFGLPRYQSSSAYFVIVDVVGHAFCSQ